MTKIFLLAVAFTISPASGQTLLAKDYKSKTIPLEHPLVLTYVFGPGSEAALNLVNYPGKASDLFFFHLHANEATAKKAGEDAVRANGGTFMFLSHSSSDRDMKAKINGTTYVFDPNRVFTKKALEEKTTPKPNARDLAELTKFVDWLKANITIARGQRARPMVTALHNNTDDDVHGELLSIKTEKKLIGVDNRAVNVNAGWDIDNFFIATLKTTFDAFVAAANPNVSLRLERPRDIGYLSNWMIADRVEYLNAETQHGDAVGNRMMVELVQKTFH